MDVCPHVVFLKLFFLEISVDSEECYPHYRFHRSHHAFSNLLVKSTTGLGHVIASLLSIVCVGIKRSLILGFLILCLEHAVGVYGFDWFSKNGKR